MTDKELQNIYLQISQLRKRVDQLEKSAALHGVVWPKASYGPPLKNEPYPLAGNLGIFG